ncbi:hypothetical protein L6452_16650 [Arctium lappa]|uniref:Uncharacterized protein n=1 Tax=Arctium lappa TaxID=4217 RepID=A0ACB9C165_ARCLA|nr:hypothetical protein L6452_16650 [Arctium lappa]
MLPDLSGKRVLLENNRQSHLVQLNKRISKSGKEGKKPEIQISASDAPDVNPHLQLSIQVLPSIGATIAASHTSTAAASPIRLISWTGTTRSELFWT